MRALQDLTVGFIGFGHMAEILCDGMLQSHVLSHSQIVFLRRDKKKQTATSKEKKISAVSYKELCKRADIIIFAMRPKSLIQVLPEIPSDIELEKKLFVSILAGVPCSTFEEHFGEKLSILRLMPNTPSSIGEGMNIFTWGKKGKKEWQEKARQIFSPMGKIEEVEEKNLDLFTVLAGSAPAIVFQCIDAFAKKGKAEGVDYEKALRVVCQTFIGSAKLLAKDLDVQRLSREIAVPGGVTEAALDAFRKEKMGASFAEVVDNAIRRIAELHP